MGKKTPYFARLNFLAMQKGPFIMPIVLIWDDNIVQTRTISLPAGGVTDSEMYIPIELEVPEGLSAGEHQFMALGFPYPHYLRFLKGTPDWHPEVGSSSYLLARFPVTVVK